jgi:hypothetical protein
MSFFFFFFFFMKCGSAGQTTITFHVEHQLLNPPSSLIIVP